MLVLSRKAGERIIISVPPSTTKTEICIEMCQITSLGRSRLGFTAPLEVIIDREEVLRDKQQRLSAATQTPEKS